MDVSKVRIYSALFAMLFIGFAAAQTTSGLAGVKCGVWQMCESLRNMLPVVAMLMVIAAGVIYAAGQIMGAETRARATTWATAMLIGAIMAILIVVVAPTVLQAIYGNTPIQCN